MLVFVPHCGDMISSSLPLSADSRWSVASLDNPCNWCTCNCGIEPASKPSPASRWARVVLSLGILQAYITHNIKYKIQHRIQHTLYNIKIKYNVKCTYIMHHYHLKYSMPIETYNHIHENKVSVEREINSKSNV